MFHNLLKILPRLSHYMVFLQIIGDCFLIVWPFSHFKHAFLPLNMILQLDSNSLIFWWIDKVFFFSRFSRYYSLLPHHTYYKYQFIELILETCNSVAILFLRFLTLSLRSSFSSFPWDILWQQLRTTIPMFSTNIVAAYNKTIIVWYSQDLGEITHTCLT